MYLPNLNAYFHKILPSRQHCKNEILLSTVSDVYQIDEYMNNLRASSNIRKLIFYIVVLLRSY